VSNGALLSVRGMRCERDERLLFENVGFDLGPGEIVQVCGPNGSGKTTLLRGLAGLSSRCEGEVYWRGELRDSAPQRFRGELLFIGHEAGVKLPLTPLENLRWNCSLWPGPDGSDDAILAALHRVQLAGYEHAECRRLSAGQRRRVGLARLLLSPALLWILDEPFTAIDVDGVALVESLIESHVADGGAALVTSHHAFRADLPIRAVHLDGAT
jgi:heme exporter protein A